MNFEYQPDDDDDDDDLIAQQAMQAQSKFGSQQPHKPVEVSRSVIVEK
jgi:hypothetical protein